MSELVVKPLRPSTWADFAALVERHHVVWGVALAALRGALQEIARLGGGTVESYPEDVVGRSVSASFLHNGSLSMFEQQGFERLRPIGKSHWVVARRVSAGREPAATGGPALSSG